MVLLFACWVIFLSSADFSKNSFGNTIRVSNGLDPDQDQHFGSKLFANFLSRQQKSLASKERVKKHILYETRLYIC